MTRMKLNASSHKQLKDAITFDVQYGDIPVHANYGTNRIVINVGKPNQITRTVDDYSAYEEGNLEDFVKTTVLAVEKGLEDAGLKPGSNPGLLKPDKNCVNTGVL